MTRGFAHECISTTRRSTLEDPSARLLRGNELRTGRIEMLSLGNDRIVLGGLFHLQQLGIPEEGRSIQLMRYDPNVSYLSFTGVCFLLR